MFKKFIQSNTSKNSSLKNVYYLIHQYGPISRATLLKITKMKKTTLARMIDELQKYNYIIESGLGETKIGRPPTLYQANAKCGYLIGIHISRTESRIILTDLLFNTIELESFTMTSLHTPAIVLPKFSKFIETVIDKYQITTDELLGISIGAIGPLNIDEGIIINPDPFPAPGWVNVPIANYFSEKFPVQCTLEYGVNMAVFGEHYRKFKEYNNILYCMSGHELGGGVIKDGRLANNNYVGDVSQYGHMIIEANGKVCTCGKKGCLVTYTSPQSILNNIMEKYKYEDWEENNLDRLKIDHVLDFLKQGDDAIDRLVKESAYYLGIGIANLITVLNSEVIILNGPLINEYPNYYEETVKSIQQHINPYHKDEVHFSKASLKDNSAAIGATIYLFYSLF